MLGVLSLAFGERTLCGLLRGRQDVRVGDGLFPQVQIEWHEVGPGFPANWRGVKVNLPEVVSSTQTNLPLEVIPAGRTIDDGSPDQLALLLAFGVRRDGGRAAILRQNDGAVSVEIFTPREN